MGFIKRAWRGQEKLWKVFWLYGFLGQFVVGLIGTGAAKAGIVGQGIFSVLFIIYAVWLLVAEWRCAFNANKKFWGYLVRILIVLSVVAGVIGFVVGVVEGVQTGQHKKSGQPDAVTSSQNPILKPLDDKHQELENKFNAIANDLQKPAVTEGAVAPQAVPQAPAVVSPEQQKKDACIGMLRANAIKTGIDAEQYVAKNSAWIDQCVKASK